MAFVSKEFVIVEFTKLKNKLNNFNGTNLKLFINYFEKNFIYSKYKIENWNGYDRIINGINLTSNSAEAYNCSFHNRFQQFYAGLKTLIGVLKKHKVIQCKKFSFKCVIQILQLTKKIK